MKWRSLHQSQCIHHEFERPVGSAYELRGRRRWRRAPAPRLALAHALEVTARCRLFAVCTGSDAE
jgi:hypothetical protein